MTYVSCSYKSRKLGLGKLLLQSVLKLARQHKCSAVRLDTVSRLSEANSLYRKLGFQPCAPYCHNPFDDALFFEHSLSNELET